MTSSVHNPFRPGSRLYRLMDEDHSTMTTAEIAEKFHTTRQAITNTMHIIRRETGYEVPFRRWNEPVDKQENYVDLYQPASPATRKKRPPRKCSTCGNIKCRIRFLAVEFLHCGEWVPMPEDLKNGR